jgi:hypothetical protein
MRYRLRLWSALLPALLVCIIQENSVAAAVKLPGDKTIEKVDFERHIMGLLGRTGCNSGSCHGSFQGKGGFRLSLFGYEPDKDFTALTRDSLARRINPLDPDNSLVLLKASGQVEHGGGVRFSRDSWQYQIFRDWIASGASRSPGSGLVKKITILPAELAFSRAGDASQLQVRATFADGAEQDITSFCDFRTNDDAVAEVSNLGTIKSLRAGSTAIVVTYRGNVMPVRVMVPMTLPAGFQYPKVPEVNYVDREVFARLRLLNMVPSELSADEAFLRRVTIDMIGQLPEPAEVRAFLADQAADKRARKIEQLLAHPLHAAMWATKFSDVTGNDTAGLENPNQFKAKRSQLWHDWLRKRFQENMPYNEIVRGILCATSRDGKTPVEWLEKVKKIDADLASGFDSTEYVSRDSLDLYWRRQGNVPIELWGERTAAAFLGVRVECAQCHKHPFDRWTQAEYRAYANIFSTIAVGSNPETKKLIDAENTARRVGAKNNNQVNLIREVYAGGNGKIFTHPDTGVTLGAKALGGPGIKLVKGQDARIELFNWMTAPDNPFFARALVNRIWAHYTGLGLVHPVDDFSLANPPSNEKLLDALAKDFLDHKFDFRHIERVILNSRTYQLSAKVNDTNRLDRTNYSHAYLRPMMAEAVVDVLHCAIGVQPRFGNDVKPGSRAVEVGATQLQNASLAYIFRIFGRPPRTTACDCERSMEPALPQKLFLMTDARMLADFNDPTNRLLKLLSSQKKDDEILDELFLAILTRLPTARDRENFAAYRQRVPGRREAFTDTVWALINTREFILNH